jgi:hypothetical protein
MSRKIYYQRGSPSKYHMRLSPHGDMERGLPPPPHFGRGWRKFRKHFGK